MTLKNQNKHWGLLDSILATILIVLGSLLVNNIFLILRNQNIFSKIFQDLHFPILILISTWIFSIKNHFNTLNSMLLTSIVFALFHFNYYNGSKLFLFIPIFFFASMLFSLLYIKSKSIWPSFISHSAYNSISLIFRLIK